MKVLRLVPLLLVIGTTGTALAQTELQWKFTPGESFTYEMTYTMDDKAPMQETDMSWNAVWSVLVDSKNPGGVADLAISFDRMKISFTSNNRTYEWDSEEEEEEEEEEIEETGETEEEGDDTPPKRPREKIADLADSIRRVILTSFKSLYENGFHLKIAEDGTVKGISGIDKARLAGTREAEEVLGHDPMTLTMVQQAIMTIFSDKQMIGRFGAVFDVLPEEAVSQGDTWEKEWKEELNLFILTIKLKTTGEFEYEGDTEKGGYDCAKLTFTSTTDFASGSGGGPGGGPGGMGGMGMEVKEGSGSGTVHFAKEQGIVVEYESEQSRCVNMPNPMSGGSMERTQNETLKVVLVSAGVESVGEEDDSF